MNPLESRKQLLIAESELNRAQLVDDMTALKTGVRTFTHRAASLGSIGSSAAVLAMGLTALQSGQPVGAGAKAQPSRIHAVLKGVVLVSALWLALSAQSRNQSDR